MFLMKFLIDEIKRKLPYEAPKYRTELLSLSRWIAERFGFKLTKVKEESKITNPVVATVSNNRTLRLSPKDNNWKNRFLAKANQLRLENPEKYNQRLERQRIN